MITNSIKKIFVLSMMFSASATAVYAAGEGHNHGHEHTNQMKSMDHGQHDMSKGSGGMFLKKKQIDGYTVSFHIMEANDSTRHGGSHNFMIKIEKDGKVENKIVINSKVVQPNGESESKMLMKMGDWYMNGYDMAHKGKYQMMILFKTADGKKHKGGVYYTK